MSRILKASFFNRDSFAVAEDLIGQTLCRRIGKRIERHTLSEIEVYDGPLDRAAHSFGKTPEHERTRIMFGPAGFWYVYLIYGVHWMLNVSTREKGYPAALLIRGCLDLSGPGRLTKALRIDKSLNGQAVARPSGLWIEEADRLREYHIEKTPRIGVDYAGPRWAGKKYRYLATPL